jgi:hypothetical protein
MISFDSEIGFVLPIENKTFDLIAESFGFPTEVLKALKSIGPRVFRHTSKAQDGTSRTCKRTAPSRQLEYDDN